MNIGSDVDSFTSFCYLLISLFKTPDGQIIHAVCLLPSFITL